MLKNDREIKKICLVLNKSFNEVIKGFLSFSKRSPLPKKNLNIVLQEVKLLEKEFVKAIIKSNQLAKKAWNKSNFASNRVSVTNINMQKYLDRILSWYPPASNAWVLDGLVIEKQIGGLKKLAGFSENGGYIIDVLNSASSIALGAHNPWLIAADRYEDHLQIRDNVCSAYHVGLRQAYAMEQLLKLYPGKKGIKLSIHSESSGTIVDSIAIDSAVAYAEKLGKNKARVLAVDGTWAGGYGSSREGTGFGIDRQQKQRAGKNIWVDRCLPPFIKENKEQILKIIKKKLNNNEVAGIYIEPDVIGDLGMEQVSSEILQLVLKQVKKNRVPIILDCVQQLGRTGGYWGENAEAIFKDYDLLIVTTSKSSSNGLPFGYVIMPKIIADTACPLSQITTNQMNGPLLRVLTVSKILLNKQLQKWFVKKSKDIELVAKDYGFELNTKGLRGKYLNRGIYVGDNEKVKLVQISLLIDDGILVGAVPSAIRYQPMLFELSETNKLIAEIIMRRIKKVLNGEVSKETVTIYKKMKKSSGLARKNT